MRSCIVGKFLFGKIPLVSFSLRKKTLGKYLIFKSREMIVKLPHYFPFVQCQIWHCVRKSIMFLNLFILHNFFSCLFYTIALLVYSTQLIYLFILHNCFTCLLYTIDLLVYSTQLLYLFILHNCFTCLFYTIPLLVYSI